MFTLATGHVTRITDWDGDAQELEVALVKPAETRRAVNYTAFTDRAQIGDKVLLNTTAHTLGLGTGGYDFVTANLELRVPAPQETQGHIIKARYLPCQHSVLTLEEQPQYADVWERDLGGLAVIVGQLHSQIGPAAAGLSIAGKKRVAYVMTDGAALPLAFSRLVGELKHVGLLHATLTCGQAFGGDHETVTLHSALLAAKHILDCDAVLVCQGPGNAGTGTKYGFSGIAQAQHLDIVKALGGTPIAIARLSGADPRERHQGISHHTRTTLDMTYARCVVPLPAGTDFKALPPGHNIHLIEDTDGPLQLLARKGIAVSSMGRTPDEDPIFFQAAAAAGLVTQEYQEETL
jgi:hypothetical protein